ncbi:MAG TPA: Gmad2 immunoglobulin-like domain-containing protein [Candidatus Limnocylindrales bacterium]|nr:Gmad2 immunoglobulin-like domain-containing protein [Candidatus Limnocylindrales bacterium]
MRMIAVVLSVLLSACGGVAAPLSSATATRATASVTPASPTSSASPTALTSAKGSITVKQPLANARISSPATISGDASVFEAALQWRITDSAGRVLAEGNTMASIGAPGRGTFTVTATFAPPATDLVGIVEVFDRSPRDGSIDEIVRVPVVVTR